MMLVRLIALLACLMFAAEAGACPQGQVDCGGGLCCSP
jgi:hypothetical protein